MNNISALKYIYRGDVIGFLLCVAFFILWPRFDLIISHLFFDDVNQIFPLKRHAIADFIYSFTHLIAATLVLGIPLLLLLSWILKKESLMQRRRTLTFLICSCLFGPGLMVNALLKDHWDRPRPKQTIDFAGHKTFEPPFQPKFDCDQCHSFVSGHASVGFYFFAFYLLSRQRKWLLLAILLGSVIGFTRIAQGGHYLSDVIFSGWVVWFSSLFLFYLFFKRQ